MDNTGIAVVNRLLRIPSSRDSNPAAIPKIALDILWIEGFFKGALLFTLDKGAYRSFTCAGLDLGRNVMIIPQKNIVISGKNPKCIGTAKLLGLPNIIEDELWAYSLDQSGPCCHLLLAIAGSRFNAGELAAILEEAGEVFVLPAEKQARREAAIRDELARFSQGRKRFQGIVLQAPPSAENGFPRLKTLAASFARIVPLPSKNALVLFSGSPDRELIKHRLVHSLKASALTAFEASTPDRALSLIRQYL
jgi:hypothetical protein